MKRGAYSLLLHAGKHYLPISRQSRARGQIRQCKPSCEVKCLLCREAESACAEQRVLADAAHAAMQARATAEAAVIAEAAALQASLSAVAADLTRMHAAADAAAVDRNALHVALQVRQLRCCTCDDMPLRHCPCCWLCLFHAGLW